VPDSLGKYRERRNPLHGQKRRGGYSLTEMGGVGDP